MDSRRGTSQDSIFMASAPPMASPSSRTRSSVNAAVWSRSRPISRDSVACDSETNSMQGQSVCEMFGQCCVAPQPPDQPRQRRLQYERGSRNWNPEAGD